MRRLWIGATVVVCGVLGARVAAGQVLTGSAGIGGTATTMNASATPLDYWRIHEPEEVVRACTARVVCPVKDVLTGVTERRTDFVGTMEKLMATGRGKPRSESSGT